MRSVRILLVDDDEDDYILTRDILNECNDNSRYILTWCNKYEEAINAMLKSHYDVYLVDYRLGQHTGLDLLREAVKSNCTEPIIILTGKGDSKIDEEAMQTGAADYLVKDSIDGQTLERSIRYALGHSKALSDLKASENKFRIIFERSKDPIVISDINGNNYDANSAALNYFEVTREEFLKTNSADYFDPAEREDFINAMESKGSVTDMELELHLPSGKIKYCGISAFLQISQHGTTELYHSILHDLTYRKHQEYLIAEKLAMSERVTKNLADKMKNPLSNVYFALDEMSSALNGHAGAVQLYIDILKENCHLIDELTSEFIAGTPTQTFAINNSF